MMVCKIIKSKVLIPIIANIPHSSKYIPPEIRPFILLDDESLKRELIRMTDSYVDELFSCIREMGGISAEYHQSRLVLDPERFEDDEKEIMSSTGMGVIYTRTSDGHKLRESPTAKERSALLDCFYYPYHNTIGKEVQGLLNSFGKCTIVDCHSFPSNPLPYELNQDAKRPDICIGTDNFHTPGNLIVETETFLQSKGLTTDRNKPFHETYVPEVFYKNDKRVSSVMIEINRGTYMNEESGAKTGSFNKIKDTITELMNHLLIQNYFE